MTLEEFKRPYTEAELKSRFDSEGYDAVLWQYCKESNDEWHDYYSAEFGKPEEGVTVENFIVWVKENYDWPKNTPREMAWVRAMCPERIEAYMSQVKIGHSHQWSKIYVEKKFRDYDEDPILETYYELFGINAGEANNELGLYIDTIPEGKNPIFKKAFLEFAHDYQTVQEVESFAKDVVFQYDKLVNFGCTSNEIFEHAYHLAEEDMSEAYYKAYVFAIENGVSANNAFNFAKRFEDIDDKAFNPAEFWDND